MSETANILPSAGPGKRPGVATGELAGAGARRLLVNGDDFGLAPEVNRAVVGAHQEGILTTTSLMVNEPHAAEAVRMARDLPRLGVGLHLVLVQGRAARPDGALVRSGGVFRDAPVRAGMAYFFRPSLRAALEGEIRAQLEAFRETGLPLDHVDGHLNVHLHPTVQSILAGLAGEHGIRAVRLMRDPLVPALRHSSSRAARKVVEGTIFRILSAIAARRFARVGIVAADRVYGLHQSGACDEAYLTHLIAALPCGTSELYCHPAEGATAEMRRRMPGYRHAEELRALVSPRIRELIEARGIVLARHADLVVPAAEERGPRARPREHAA